MVTQSEISSEFRENDLTMPSSKLNRFVKSLGAIAGGFLAIEMALINMTEAAFSYDFVPDETAYSAITGGVLMAVGCILSIADDEKKAQTGE